MNMYSLAPFDVWQQTGLDGRDGRLRVAFSHQGDSECQGPLLRTINIVHVFFPILL